MFSILLMAGTMDNDDTNHADSIAVTGSFAPYAPAGNANSGGQDSETNMRRILQVMRKSGRRIFRSWHWSESDLNVPSSANTVHAIDPSRLRLRLNRVPVQSPAPSPYGPCAPCLHAP